MPFDYKLVGPCNHLVSQILNVAGSSPNFYADLEVASNGNPAVADVLELSGTCMMAIFAMEGDIANFSFSNGMRFHNLITKVNQFKPVNVKSRLRNL